MPTPKMLWNVRHFFVLRSKRAAQKLRANDFAYVDELVRRWSPAWKDMPADETARVKEAFAAAGLPRGRAAPTTPRCRHAAGVAARDDQGPGGRVRRRHDIFSPRAYEKARHCFDASYEVVKVPGGHFMHREHPSEFIAELTRHVRAAR